MEAASHAASVKAGEEARAYRDAHRQRLEDGYAADRRRAAGLDVDDMRIVNHFIEWAKHVDRFRTAGQIREAVKAWHQMNEVIYEHDPADSAGNHRLWDFTKNELRWYYGSSPHSDKRHVKDGFFDFWIDCLGGFYRAFESKPQPDAPAAAPAAERVDAGGASSLRLDIELRSELGP
jgi:hypothetical protein